MSQPNQSESLFAPVKIDTSHWQQDVTANKHKGNANSVAAHDRIKEKKRMVCAEIYEYIVAQQDRGATSKEIVAAFGKNPDGSDKMPLQTVSARMADLLALEMIVESGERRGGCGIRKAVFAK